MEKMYNIDITVDEVKMVRKYANETAETYPDHGRNRNGIVDNIFTGKIGEIGFSKIFKTDPPKFEAHYDDGYDFLVNGNKIDVKTLDGHYKKRVYIHHLTAEYFAVVFYDKFENTVEYIGNLSTLYIMENLLWNGCYVNRDEFERNVEPVFL